MSIRVEHEDIEELRKWGMGLSNIMELCVFCGYETRYWHRPTNTPVCPNCAQWHEPKELEK